MKTTPLKNALAIAAAACLTGSVYAAESKAEMKADAKSAAAEAKADTKAAAAEIKADSKAAAADAKSAVTDRNDPALYSDRAHAKASTDEKDRLEQHLKAGQPKGYYTKALNDQGYTVTSVNKDSADGVEYEVVKGDRSYEVQIAFDKSGKATKVDVDNNLWRAKSTKEAMAGKKVAAATAYEKGNEAYSDRAHLKDWTGEKDRLEKSLALGHDPAWYRDQLKKMGYQITSVNDRDKDYVEYEVVKGKDSYEVQIDLANGKAKKIDVTTNAWQSDATDRALSATTKH